MKLSIKLIILIFLIHILGACSFFGPIQRDPEQVPRRRLVVVSEEETQEPKIRREFIPKEKSEFEEKKLELLEEFFVKEEIVDKKQNEEEEDEDRIKFGLDISKETKSIFKPYDPEKDKEEPQFSSEGPIPPEIQEELLGKELFLEEPVTLNFEEAPIEQILNAVSETLGINFIMAAGTKGGKITMQTAKPVPASDLFPILQSVLEVNGITLVKSGHYYKVIKSQEAKQYPIEVLAGKEAERLSHDDTFVTQIIPLDYIPVNDIVSILKPFLSKSATDIIKHEDLNIMIINDLSSNMRRLLTFVNELDKPIYQPDEKVYVYYIKNGNAEKLASTLNSIYKEKQKTKKKEQQFQTVSRRLPDGSVQNFKVPVGGPYAALMQGQEVTGKVTIVADKEINALIIITSPKDYEAVLSTIEKLDILPKQALIEAMIVDITLDDSTKFGINWKMFLEGGNAEFAGRSQSLGLGIDKDGAISSASSIIYDINLENFIGKLDLLSQNNKMNVISTPYVMALDNNEANIDISTQYGYTTKSTDVNGQTTEQMNFKEVGIKLKVTPHINENNLVTLDISQEVSHRDESDTYVKRQATSKVVVRGGKTIVIGGLIQKKRTETKSGIPLLSELPVLGHLFGTTAYEWTKTELLIFLTPHVVSTQQEIMDLTADYQNKSKKLKEMIEEDKENR